MSIEDLSNYWNTIFLAPLAFLLHRFVNHSNRIGKLETKQNIYTKKMDEVCKSNRELSENVNRMIGRMDEHLRK